MKIASLFIAFLSLAVAFLLSLLSKVVKRKDSEISSLKKEIEQAQVQSATKEKESEISRSISHLVVNTLQNRLEATQKKKEVEELLQNADGTLSEADIIAFGQKQIEIDKERRQ